MFKSFKFSSEKSSPKQIFVLIILFLSWLFIFSWFLLTTERQNALQSTLIFNVAVGSQSHFSHIRTASYICSPGSTEHPGCLPHAQDMSTKYDLFIGGIDPRNFNSNTTHLIYTVIFGATPSSGKIKAMADYCADLTHPCNLDDLFLHFKIDTTSTLFIHGTTQTETRVQPGWDPGNDKNNDGQVDDAEFASRVNLQASARTKTESRIQDYYWEELYNNDPTSIDSIGDYLTDISNQDYVNFMAIYAKSLMAPTVTAFPEDGLFSDSLNPYFPRVDIIGHILETAYSSSDQATLDAQYKNDIKKIITVIKTSIGSDNKFIGNWWYIDPAEGPLVADGRLLENWKDINSTLSKYISSNVKHTSLDDVQKLDDNGAIQILQYNLMGESYFDIYDDAAKNREKIFGLASYYLYHGAKTYFAQGQDGIYQFGWERWFNAIEYPMGQPLGRYFFWDAPETANVLQNGNFESGTTNWTLGQPSSLDSSTKQEGLNSLKIEVSSINTNSDYQSVNLEPNTTYTLSGWIKTENVPGGGGGKGAQVYYYNPQSGSQYIAAIEYTNDWKMYSKTFTTGANTANGLVVIKIKGGAGKAWFDNLILAKGDTVPVNVLQNGNFESGTTNWTLGQPSSLDSSTKQEGLNSLKIEVSSINTNIDYQSVNLEPNTTYTLIAWIKTENVPGGGGGKGAQVYYYNPESGGQYLPTVEYTKDWKMYSKTFTTGANTANGKVSMRIKGGAGKAWFDSLVLVKGSAY